MNLLEHASDRILVVQEDRPLPRVTPDVEWVLWFPPGAAEGGAMPGAYAQLLLDWRAALADLPWEPVTKVPAHTPLAELLTRPLTGMLALEAADGTLCGVVPAPRLVQLLGDAYRRLNAQHQVALAAANDAITIIDENQQVLAWNPEAERLFGIRTREIVAAPIDRFFDTDRLACCRVIRDGKGVWRHPHVPREGVRTIITSLPFAVDGRVAGAISVEHDVTQFVRLQTQLADAQSRMTYLESKVRGLDDPCRRIVGRGAHREQLVERIRKAAATSATVLIHGESGVGKELVARAVHELSERSEKPFVTVNCGAIPPTLFESELFGYEGGAFTGADRRGKAGFLEAADGGTLFLDEVGELPLDLQVKLLRALEERKFYRIGATVPRSVDIRIVTATNRNLAQMMEKGTFRQDLFFRLRVVSLEVVPLRERREDLPDLIDFFLTESAARYLRKVTGIEPDVMEALLTYDWPGNVRELRNVVEQLVVMADDGILRMACLPGDIRQGPAPAGGEPIPAPPAVPTLEAAERQAVLTALQEARGNRSAAARLLGISRPTLYARLRAMGRSAKEY